MDIGVPELIIILFVVLIIFGPGRIVKVSRELGEGIRQFRHGLETPAEIEKADNPSSSAASIQPAKPERPLGEPQKPNS